jgi:uncharacterized membrane protein
MPNTAHLHLMLTHVPVLSTLFGLGLLLISLVQGNQDLRRVGLWACVLGALSAVPTYLTGRPASALLVKLLPGTSMDASDQHAEVAVIALIATSVLGIAALIGLVLYRPGKRAPGWYNLLTLFLAILTSGLMAWTATLGGKIRHSEVMTPRDLQNVR